MIKQLNVHCILRGTRVKKEKKKDKREASECLETLRTVACAVSYQSSVWHPLVKGMSEMSSGQSAICSLPTPKTLIKCF